MDELLRAALASASSGTAEPCPPADDLAASIEGRLSAAEQRRLDEHFAVCGRCRETLALSKGLEVIPADYRTVIEHGHRRKLLPTPWPAWRWFAPPAAALAGVVLYFVVTGAPGAGRPTAPVPEATVAQQLPAARDVGDLDEAKVEAVPLPATVPGPQPAQKSPRESAVGSERLKDAPAEVPRALRPQTAQPLSQPTLPAPATLVVAEPPTLQAAAPVIEAQRAQAASEKVAERRADAAAGRSGAVGFVAGVTPVRALAEAPGKGSTGGAPVRVVSPDGLTEWQFGPEGAIRRSTDSGRTWHPQPPGASGEILAASAVSATVCWAVGRAGLVIVTADGERWQSRPAPEVIDLVRVLATDARSATVTAADGRRFATADGGATWAPAR